MDEAHGCDGGKASEAFTYLMDHWAYLEEDYRYKGDDHDCKYHESEAKSSSGIKLSTYVCVQPNDPSGMIPAVA